MKNKNEWQNFFDAMEIEIDKLLIKNYHVSPYELFKANNDRLYISNLTTNKGGINSCINMIKIN